MIRSSRLRSLLILVACAASQTARASQLVEAKLETKLVPSPVQYNVLLPDGYEAERDALPLLLFLHGGGGDRSFLARMRPTIDEMWKSGALPKMVVVTPSASRSFTWTTRTARRNGSRSSLENFSNTSGRLTKSLASAKARCCLESRWVGLARCGSGSSTRTRKPYSGNPEGVASLSPGLPYSATLGVGGASRPSRLWRNPDRVVASGSYYTSSPRLVVFI